ncbi:MAG TPA: N-acetylmuramoyl-L-alanine amidase [Anaerolineae bacterium]|nr:N-acetylmuramoyl-L-alanine amidase [Anaerolineae bacterium]
MRKRQGRRTSRRLLWIAIGACVTAGVIVGCTLFQEPTPTPAPDLHALRLMVQVRVEGPDQVVISYRARNNGTVSIPRNHAFGGVWELVGPDGETVMEGTVDRLPEVQPGEELTALAQWRGPLSPGAYKVVWGAPGYSSTVVYWDLGKVDGELKVVFEQVHDSLDYPPTSGARAQEWTQTTATDFRGGTLDGLQIEDRAGGELVLAPGADQGTYTSPVVDAAFCFIAIAPRWQADVPEDSSVQVEVRVQMARKGWSEWYSLDPVLLRTEQADRSPADKSPTALYPETPLMLSDGRQFQYRATLQGSSPVLHAVTLTYLDTTVGPTTVQAKAFAAQGQPANGVPQPAIITRAGWGADESHMDWSPEHVFSRKIVIHHTVTTNDYTEAEAAKWVRAVYYYHAVTLGWGDIGYSYLVDRYGNIYEGRYGGPDAVAGHTYGYNYGSTGVALIGTHGNYASSVPASEAALRALEMLAAWEGARAGIHPFGASEMVGMAIPNLAGHRDFPPYRTTCPGDEAYAQLPELRQAVWEHMRPQLFRYNVSWRDWTEPVETLVAGTTYSAAIEVLNTGWFTWPHDDPAQPVRLGYHWTDSAGRPVAQLPQDDHRTKLERAVPFGDTYRFAAKVTTPRTPGRYTIAWDMAHEGVAWFHDAVPASPLLQFTIDVVEALPEPPTPTPPAELIVNGGFEQEGGWVLHDTSYPARYVQEPRYAGARALQTGIEEGGRNTYSYSSAEQTLVLPASGDIRLRYWYTSRVDGTDFAYVFLRDSGQRWRLLMVNRVTTGGWTGASHDLNVYAGQAVTLRFGTFNDGQRGTSAMYVDEVRVDVDGLLPTETPVPTSTPTSTPTWTPVPTSTPTKAPTETPQPSPTPAEACIELAVNGGFEAESGWEIANTPYRARYTDATAYSGQRSMQLGMESAGADRFSYSSVGQRIAVPSGHNATIGLWYTVPQAGGSGDYGYFLLRPVGGSWRTIRIVRDRTAGWQSLEVDVSHYAGQAFDLRLGLRNDGRGDGAVAVMYVDQLSIEACLP